MALSQLKVLFLFMYRKRTGHLFFTLNGGSLSKLLYIYHLAIKYRFKIEMPNIFFLWNLEGVFYWERAGLPNSLSLFLSSTAETA